MTQDEAAQVWGMLVAIYGVHPERQREIAGPWTTALLALNVRDTMEVVDVAMKGGGATGGDGARLPTIVQFARDVRRVGEKVRESAPRLVECGLCLDDGWVIILQPDEDDLMTTNEAGPCPRCPAGKAIEYPLEGRGPWGEGGYWHGEQWTTERLGIIRLQEVRGA